MFRVKILQPFISAPTKKKLKRQTKSMPLIELGSSKGNFLPQGLDSGGGKDDGSSGIRAGPNQVFILVIKNTLTIYTYKQLISLNNLEKPNSKNYYILNHSILPYNTDAMFSTSKQQLCDIKDYSFGQGVVWDRVLVPLWFGLN